MKRSSWLKPIGSLRRDQRGTAFAFVHAIMILIVCGIVWYIGNQVLFGPSGIGTYYENEIPEDQRPTTGTYKWVWNVWPIVVIIGAAVYTIMAGQVKEPRYYGGY